MSPRRRRPAPSRGPVRSARSGFTLIELLTVIAIIALLAGILFPVFGSVRENARRSQTMNNLREIQMAVKQYQLDNRSYPDFLFGPAVKADGTIATADGDETLTMEQVASLVNSSDTSPAARAIKAIYSKGLFPEYVKSIETFGCPNNDVSKSPKDNIKKVVPAILYDRKRTPPTFIQPVAFYAYDSYDTSPAITGPDAVDKNVFLQRYSRAWTAIPAEGEIAAREEYKRQLIWRNPPEDTYLTMTTYHVPQGKVLVQFLNGTAKVMDVAKLNNFQSNVQGRDYDMYRLKPTD